MKNCRISQGELPARASIGKLSSGLIVNLNFLIHFTSSSLAHLAFRNRDFQICNACQLFFTCSCSDICSCSHEIINFSSYFQIFFRDIRENEKKKNDGRWKIERREIFHFHRRYSRCDGCVVVLVGGIFFSNPFTPSHFPAALKENVKKFMFVGSEKPCGYIFFLPY